MPVRRAETLPAERTAAPCGRSALRRWLEARPVGDVGHAANRKRRQRRRGRQGEKHPCRPVSLPHAPTGRHFNAQPTQAYLAGPMRLISLIDLPVEVNQT